MRRSIHDPAQRLYQAVDEREAELSAGRARINADLRRGRVSEPHHPFADFVKPAMLLALNTGLRRKEQLSLRWDDIDLHARTVTVRTSKTKRSQDVPINDELLAVLSAWRAQCYSSNVHPMLVFPNAVRRNIKAFDDIRRAARIRTLRWHDLRHTFATWAVAGGAPLDVASRWLGHSRIEQTMRYAHRAPEYAASAINAVSRGQQAANRHLIEAAQQ